MGMSEARAQFKKELAKNLTSLIGVLKEDWSGVPRADRLELVANCLKALRLFTFGAGSVDAILREYPQFLNQIATLLNSNNTNNIIQSEAAQIVRHFSLNKNCEIPDELSVFIETSDDQIVPRHTEPSRYGYEDLTGKNDKYKSPRRKKQRNRHNFTPEPFDSGIYNPVTLTNKMPK